MKKRGKNRKKKRKKGRVRRASRNNWRSSQNPYSADGPLLVEGEGGASNHASCAFRRFNSALWNRPPKKGSPWGKREKRQSAYRQARAMWLGAFGPTSGRGGPSCGTAKKNTNRGEKKRGGKEISRQRATLPFLRLQTAAAPFGQKRRKEPYPGGEKRGEEKRLPHTTSLINLPLIFYYPWEG